MIKEKYLTVDFAETLSRYNAALLTCC